MIVLVNKLLWYFLNTNNFLKSLFQCHRSEKSGGITALFKSPYDKLIWRKRSIFEPFLPCIIRRNRIGDGIN